MGSDETDRLVAEVAAVVRNGNCSGCGACAAMSPRIGMALSDAGYMRPFDRGAVAASRASASSPPEQSVVGRFRVSCPGLTVAAARPPGSRRDVVFGPVVKAWVAWAVDEQVRRLGSSGGAITALTTFLLECEGSSRVVAAGADARDPRRTAVTIARSREELVAAAGSRYAPVSIASAADAWAQGSVTVGKPCEVSALRAGGTASAEGPFLVSFLCAGVPSQHATDDLVARGLGERDIPPLSLRYRGDGWPGAFRVEGRSGATLTLSYDEAWGDVLGPTIQWRCKICPDGVGESADVVAGDFWFALPDGRPDFRERPGRSVLIARTQRGAAAVERAIAAGALAVEDIDLSAVAAVQQHQVTRRRTLFGRLVGSRLGGSRVPRFSGFDLARLAARSPLSSARALAGSLVRARAARAMEGATSPGAGGGS